jgi:hypothetical protein
MVGEFLERDGIVVLDPAAADLVAVAVEEGDRELGFLQPVLVRGLAESRNRERQHQDHSAGAERCAFGEGFDQAPALPAGDMEPVHEGREALIDLARPAAGLEHGRIDPRIEVQEQAVDPGFPAGRKEVAQGDNSR